MQIRNNVSFKELTTLNVGGSAHTVMYPESEEELIESVLKEKGNFLILGGGSNVLASDNDYTGAVIVPSFKKIQTQEGEDGICIDADSGVVWDELVKHTVENGWWGLENLSGIPGTVGGAVFQNIGAYGAVFSSVIESVEVYDTQENIKRTFTKDECEFGYRTSIFKKERGRYVILSTRMVVKKHGQPNITYTDLATQFAHDPSPRISAVRTAVLGIRKKKFPQFGEYGTAGSFFLNPVVSKEEAARFQEKYPDIPLFTLPEGGIKIPLAWILDKVIDAKELCVGGACVWKNQALVIATKNGATASDVRNLQEEIKEKVFNATNITITPEVHIL